MLGVVRACMQPRYVTCTVVPTGQRVAGERWAAQRAAKCEERLQLNMWGVVLAIGIRVTLGL